MLWNIETIVCYCAFVILNRSLHLFIVVSCCWIIGFVTHITVHVVPRKHFFKIFRNFCFRTSGKSYRNVPSLLIAMLRPWTNGCMRFVITFPCYQRVKELTLWLLCYSKELILALVCHLLLTPCHIVNIDFITSYCPMGPLLILCS